MGKFKVKLSDDYYLDKARVFFQKHNRAPKSDELGRHVRKISVDRFGSWESFIKKAINVDPYFKFKIATDDDLKKLIVAAAAKLGRTPNIGELPHLKVMVKRFGGPNEAMEAALFTSPRVAVLKALRTLTSPECSEASTGEIVNAVNKNGMEVTNVMVSSLLARCVSNNLATSRRVDLTTTWSITNNGIQFINKFKGKKDVDRTR